MRLEVQGGNIVGSTLVDDGAWHHVAVVCDDFDGGGSLDLSGTKIDVDGVSLGTTETGRAPLSAEDRLERVRFETAATTTDEPVQ